MTLSGFNSSCHGLIVANTVRCNAYFYPDLAGDCVIPTAHKNRHRGPLTYSQ